MFSGEEQRRKINTSIWAWNSPAIRGCSREDGERKENEEGTFKWWWNVIIMRLSHFLLLIIKLHSGVLGVRATLVVFMTSPAHSKTRTKRKKRSCLTIQISCYLMAHIIIIKNGEAKSVAAVWGQGFRRTFRSRCLSPSKALDYVLFNLTLPSVADVVVARRKESEPKGRKKALLMILMMIYEFVLKAQPCLHIKHFREILEQQWEGVGDLSWFKKCVWCA